MKPFKETKLGKFLANAAPKILDVVGDVLPDTGVLGIVKNIIDRDPDITAEQKAAIMHQVQEFEKELLAMEMADRQNARAMQVAALQQEDVFSKRYLYYLSSFVVMAATGFGVMLFFVEFPEENRRLVEMFADIYLFAGALMVLQFYFGSSKGSHDKGKMLGV